MTTVNLKSLVEAEIARRAAASATFLPFSFIVDDGPAALTNVAVAVAAAEEERESRSGRTYVRGGETEQFVARKPAPTIAPSIQAAVEAALAAAHPKQFSRPGIGIICHSIVHSGRRHAEVPETGESTGTGISPAARIDDDEAVQRAAERLAKLRGEF